MRWQQALSDYIYYLKLERGLSQNSINSYALDIEKLIRYIDSNAINATPLTIDAELIKLFVYDISKVVNQRSQSRTLSGLRSFFDFLIFENYRDTNPMTLIESPKIGRKLPDTLSTAEIDLLISKIDLSHPQGERNKPYV